MGFIKAISYAKVNLNLRIVGKCPGGYHSIQSIFHPLDFLYDEITISTSNSKQDTIVVNRASYIEEFEELLIAKCLNLMRKSYNFDCYFNIILNKNIPVGAGLGGGSSNAGTIIYAVSKLLKLNLSIQQKIDIGRQIGADVPFFIYNKPCIIEGIGEKITIIQNPKRYFILLATPNFNVSTPLVYKKYASSITKGKLQYSKPLDHKQLILQSEIAKNDLQTSAQQIQPKLAQLLDSISNSDNCIAHAISGSGSSCFGIFQDKMTMEKAAKKLQKQFEKYQFFSGIC